MATLTPPPLQSPITQKGEGTMPAWVAWLQALYFFAKALGGFGATGSRPSVQVYVGMEFFDTSLGKPIWLKVVGPPTVWVDATGSVV